MSTFRTGLAVVLAIGGLAAASAASAQPDRYAIDRYAVGPSTPNSDGSRGYGSYVAMAGSSFVDGRRYGDRYDDRVYPLDTAARPPAADAYAYAPNTAPPSASADYARSATAERSSFTPGAQ